MRSRATFCGLLGLAWLTTAGRATAQAPTTYLSKDSAAVLARARADIAHLAADSLHGRGYQAYGHLLAARAIAARFRGLGLGPLAAPGTDSLGAYFQSFSFQANLADSAQLAWGSRALRPGYGFLVHPASAPARFSRPLRVVSGGYGTPLELAGRRLAGCALRLRAGLPRAARQWPDSLRRRLATDGAKIEAARQAGAAAVVLERAKLTASFAPEAVALPVLEVPRQAPQVRTIWPRWEAGVQPLRSQNVIAMLPAGQPTDSLLILCAHYDHLGRQGGAFFPGANDNASGVAFLLALANALRQGPPLRHHVLFIAFGAEEVGLVGSRRFVDALPPEVLRRIRLVLNFDLLGNGDAGATLVNAPAWPAELGALLRLNDVDSLRALPSLRARNNAPNSDHWPFTQQGVPALFLYTEGGPPHYHDVHDRPQTVRLPVFVRLVRLFEAYIRRVSG